MTDKIEFMDNIELVGIHVFVGMDVGEYQSYGEPCERVYFNLDGKVYVVDEDIQDGYRSSAVLPYLDKTGYVIKNTFDPIVVMVTNETGKNNCNDILRFTDPLSKKVIFEIGTTDIDDYYPSYHMEYIPENMSVNNVKD